MVKEGIHRHYKGNFYEVIGIGQHSETEEKLVVYRALYGEHGLWVRPLEMFDGFTDDDQKRFTYIGESDGEG